MIKKALTKIVNSFGYDIVKHGKKLKPNFDEYKEFIELFEFCQEYTMTSVERMFALYKSVEYIIKNDIKGDFVECGVWRGGSSMMIAKTLQKFNVTDRKIYLYDTFEGMSEPTEKDVTFKGYTADSMLKKAEKEESTSVWCYADLDDVQNNMNKTGYPAANISFIKGKVEDTIPQNMPQGDISLLRLDTDWYESTKHEMVNLYPHLVKNGVLIIDDYGHWQGARQAIDEYFEENKPSPLLNRIDYTGKIAVKI